MVKLMEFKTVQSTSFRTLIEALKEILTETNIEFNSHGMKIVAMDNTHTVLVHLLLQGKQFELYSCKSRIVVGVSVINLYKIMRTMTGNDTLCWFIEVENDNEVPNNLSIRIENSEKKIINQYQFNLIDLDQGIMAVPPAEFDCVILISASYFQKMCKDMLNLSEKVEIQCIGNTLKFICRGDFCTQELILGESSGCMQFTKISNDSIPIVGIYELKHLVMFTKCTNLCSNVYIYIKNDYPIIIQYKVADLGAIKLCLAPKIKDN
jgi:proliferating cell nuclear antigen